MVSEDALLGAARIRAIAEELDLRPTKQWGQNFVIDANTVRRIVRLSAVHSDDRVIEVGPGLGSLTLGLLPAVRHLTAVEIDPRLAERLPVTVGDLQPGHADRLTVLAADALSLTPDDVDEPPTALVANLPYNVSVPVILHLLATFPTIGSALVMVQAEVADRLAAPPGSRTYGVPSAKLAWFGEVHRVGSVPPSVFWPEPRIDSGLVSFTRGVERGAPDLRDATFAVIDAAFSQRRKALRSALAGWAGGLARADAILEAAEVPALTRGEQLGVDDFMRIAVCARG